MELSLKAKLENRWSGAGYVRIPVKSQPAEKGLIRLGEKVKRPVNSGREQIAFIAVDIVKSIDRWLQWCLG